MTDNELKIEELRNKYLPLVKEYFNNLDPYNYNNEIWEEIKIKYSITLEKIEAINTDNDQKFKKYFDEYYDSFRKDVKSMQTLKSEELTSREIFIRNIQNISEKITSGIVYIWKKIMFLFAIPGCTFASFVFSFFITLVFGTFIVWFIPQAYTDNWDGVVDSVIAAFIFVLIRFMIMRDVYLNQPEKNIKTYLIKHTLAMGVWWFIFLFIRYKENITCVFSYSYIEWSIYLPYLSIAAFAREWFIVPLITYFILNTLPILMMLIYIYFMEKVFDKRQIYIHDSDTKPYEDSYDYHFDINMDVDLNKEIIDEKTNKK